MLNRTQRRTIAVAISSVLISASLLLGHADRADAAPSTCPPTIGFGSPEPFPTNAPDTPGAVSSGCPQVRRFGTPINLAPAQTTPLPGRFSGNGRTLTTVPWTEVVVVVGVLVAVLLLIGGLIADRRQREGMNQRRSGVQRPSGDEQDMGHRPVE